MSDSDALEDKMGFAEADMEALGGGLGLCVVDELSDTEKKTIGDKETEGVIETDSFEVWIEGFSAEFEGVNGIDVDPDGVAEEVVETEADVIELGI